MGDCEPPLFSLYKCKTFNEFIGEYSVGIISDYLEALNALAASTNLGTTSNASPTIP